MGPIRRYVSDQGDDIDAADGGGVTGLHRAAWNGHGEVCRFLVENGADTGKRNKYGRTAAQLAEEENYPMVLAVLPLTRDELLELALPSADDCCSIHTIKGTS